MSKNELSSVEFFLKRLIELRVDKNVLYENVHEAYQQAKAMHKEEIIKACEDCSTIDGEFLSGEKYYKETFE